MGNIIHLVDKVESPAGTQLDLTTASRLSFNGEGYAKVSELGSPADGSVTTAKIVDLNVTTEKIANDAIDSTKLADDSVGSEHLAAGAVDTAALGADSVNGDKIADDSIGSEHLAASSVDTTAVADSAITPAKLSQAMVEVYRVDYDLSSAADQTFLSSAPADLIIKSVMCVKDTLADGDGGSIQLGLSGDADAILGHIFDLTSASLEKADVGYLNASVQDLIATIAAGTATQGTGSFLIEGVK